MTKTYSSNPFISHDGPDAEGHRAEVKVVTGLGMISNKKKSDAGKAYNVIFDVDNTQYSSSGWIPSDSGLMDTINEHEENDEPLYFRIETVRKRGVDRHTPITDLTKKGVANENVFKSLVGIKVNEEDEWSLTTQAKTRPDEDPKSYDGGNANDYSKEELDKLKKPTSNNSYSSNNNSFEAPPFKTHNNDGSVNLGSFAVGTPMSMFSYVTDYFRAKDEEITAKEAKTLAQILLQISNNAQVKMYDGEIDSPDLTAGSHTRARAVMYEVIRFSHPLTKDLVENKELRKTWSKEVLVETLQMWKWSVAVSEKYL